MKNCAFLLALTCLLTSSLTAYGTTLQEKSLEDLTLDAETIVVGRCLESSSEWHGRTLVTRVTLAVEKSLSGPATERLTLFLPGGIDSNRPVPVAITYPGAPQLTVDEQALFFLRSIPDTAGHRLVGFSQGMAPLRTDAKGRQVLAASFRQGGGSPMAAVEEEIQRILAARSEEVKR